MITATWTNAPADRSGQGSSDVARCSGPDSRTLIGVGPAPRVAPVRLTTAPTGVIAERVRPVFRQERAQVAPFAHNSIGTTLGICSSRRPLS
jgi:hypothetical protein